MDNFDSSLRRQDLLIRLYLNFWSSNNWKTFQELERAWLNCDWKFPEIEYLYNQTGCSTSHHLPGNSANSSHFQPSNFWEFAYRNSMGSHHWIHFAEQISEPINAAQCQTPKISYFAIKCWEIEASIEEPADWITIVPLHCKSYANYCVDQSPSARSQYRCWHRSHCSHFEQPHSC